MKKIKIKTILVLLVASIINVVGVNVFLTPLNIYPIGITGISYELSTILSVFGNFNEENLRGIIYFIINIPLMWLAWKSIGKKFTWKTMLTISFISIMINIVPVPAQSPITDPLLSVLASACLCGLGIGILLNNGTSSGGTDIISLYFSLRKNKSFGIYNIIFNTLVITIAIVLTQDITMAVYMIILVYVTSVVVDKVHKLSKKYTLFVITKKAPEIKNKLYANEIVRGITIFESKGGFSNENNNTLMLTCENVEYYMIIKIILEEDKTAFINTFETVHVFGEFNKMYKKMLN